MVRIFIYLIVFIVFSGAVSAQESAPIPPSEVQVYPAAGKYGMVTAQHHIGAEVGAEILAKGGNAVDAAIATCFALAVVLPRSGNIGGGGFMLVYLADEQKTIAIDYREMAPALAVRDVFLDENGNVDKAMATRSTASAGVPGTVAGFWLAHQKYGSLPWKDLLQPAIKLAEEGFPVSLYLSKLLKWKEPMLSTNQAGRDVFYKGGQGYYEPGEILVQKDLGRTLRLIAERGPSGFYEGPVADLMVAEMNHGAGFITHDDLKNYRAVIREAVTGTYRGYDIASMPPPSSGGVHIVQMLNILENFDLKAMGHNSAAEVEALAEAMKYAFADRSEHLGDPDFYDVPLDWITSKAYAREIADKIRATGVQPAATIMPGTPQDNESFETNHFGVVDKFGNAVANTYTLNYSYGSGIMVSGAGFLLNNEMDDFSAKVGVPNGYGLLGGDANAIAPGKRPLSSMTPTIVLKDGKPVFITGSPGGSRIITGVLQSIVNFIDYGLHVGEAVMAPRIHHQGFPDRLLMEPGFSPDTVQKLREAGYDIAFGRGAVLTAVEAIEIDDEGWMYGFADPRRADGAAVGLCVEDKAESC